MRKVFIGKKFARLTVIERTNETLGKAKNHRVWLCKCDCGNITYVTGSNLLYGTTRSCGCLRSEIVSKMRKNEKYKKAKENVN